MVTHKEYNETMFNQISKSFWNDKLYFRLGIHRVFYGGFGLGYRQFELYTGLNASPYPATTVGFNIHPLKGACAINGTHTRNNWTYAVNVQLARGGMKLEPNVSYKPNPETTLGSTLSISGNKLMLKTGVNYNLDVATSVYMGVKGGLVFDQYGCYWLSGMNFSFNFHSFAFSLPITLGSYNLANNTSSLLFTIGLMALGILGFSYFSYRDVQAKKYFACNNNNRKEEIFLHDRYVVLIENFANYKSMMQELARYAEDKRFLERINNGLLILEAYYGKLSAVTNISKNPNYRPVNPLQENMKQYMRCQAVDVRDLLQIMTSNGKLLISRSFSKYPGLIDPLMDKKAERGLCVRVKYRGLEKRAVVRLGNDTSVIIPRDMY
eukprot:TRINITY_DN3484_c0_g2_i17.p1 TRINITY_DN3484_c0_g2~~TRINITY_DN3484_c0_g2_i17.p1  ORF type:complete len:380 (-),score=95.01 TRINITY_DN3484_c0_g2_i17:63-1202(-)